MKQKFLKDTSLAINGRTGFTLIELLVVIAIIALLASLILVVVNSTRQKARDARRVADISQLSKALELYYNANFSYPTTGASVGLNSFGPISGSAAPCAPSTAGCLNGFIPNFLIKAPVAPLPAETIGYDCSQAYGTGIANDYQYAGTNGANVSGSYTVTFCIGSPVGSLTTPGVHTLTPSGIR